MDFDKHLAEMADGIKFMISVDAVLDQVRSVYYGRDQRKKQQYNKLLFLVTDPNAANWVEKALQQYQETPILSALEQDMKLSSISKCLLVKSYRELNNKKKKAGDQSEITPEEIVAQFAKNIGQ